MYLNDFVECRNIFLCLHIYIYIYNYMYVHIYLSAADEDLF